MLFVGMAINVLGVGVGHVSLMYPSLVLNSRYGTEFFWTTDPKPSNCWFCRLGIPCVASFSLERNLDVFICGTGLIYLGYQS